MCKSQENAWNNFGFILSELHLSYSCAHRETEIISDLKSNWYLNCELINNLFLSRIPVLTCSLLMFSSGCRRRWILTHSLCCGSIAGGWTLCCGRYLMLLCSISPDSHLSNSAQVIVLTSVFFNNVVNTDGRTVGSAEEICFQNTAVAVNIWWVLQISYVSSSYGLIWKIPEESSCVKQW